MVGASNDRLYTFASRVPEAVWATKAAELREKYASQGEQEEDDGLENAQDALYEGYEDADVDELKEEMDKIKVLCIATHIMEMTRTLADTEKKLLSRFCDEI